MSNLSKMLIRHEGLKLKSYRDTVGKLTIGVGRNLDDLGITRNEALYLLRNDIARVKNRAKKSFPWFIKLNYSRRNVVLNMIFNLGFTKFRKFKKTIRAIKGKNWDMAAKEMLDSKWASQVGWRAKKLSKIMKTGRF